MARLIARLAFCLGWLALAACESTLGPHGGRDAQMGMDAGTDPVDASTAIDAAALDASAVDASVVDASITDASTPMDGGSDAGGSADAGWGPCMLGSAMGTCMSVSDCAPPASMPVMGLCPGPADIQCCLPAREPGTVTPADVIARLGSCSRIGGDYARDSGGTANIPVCQTDEVIWWAADFDIDCDGGRGAICMSDPYYLPETSGVDSMGRPLDASTLPFIVIPLASSRFRYADHGIRIGTVGLVLYRDRMVYGIFGDAGPGSIIGEGSFAMAEALGIPSNPSTGGVDSGVTYLFFTGSGTRVTRNEDHAEAVRLGEVLLDAFLTP